MHFRTAKNMLTFGLISALSFGAATAANAVTPLPAQTTIGIHDAGYVYSMPDPTLRRCVNHALGFGSEVTTEPAEGTMNGIQYLSCMYVADLTGIEQLTSLTNFTANNGTFSDLGPLQQLNPQILSIQDNEELASLEPLRNMTNLQQFYLSNSQVQDLSPLENLPLTQLWAVNNKIETLGNIASNPQSVNAQINLDENHISDISSLAATGLMSLSIVNNTVADVSPILEMPQLISLDISGNPVLDFSPVEQLSNLTELSMRNIPNALISTLPDLSQLTNLTSLELNDNQISDLSPLPTMPNLQRFSASNNTITDLSPLADSNNLQDLIISENQVQDLSPLSEMTQLQNLDVSRNPLNGDIAVVSEFTNLRTLQLASTGVVDVTPTTNLDDLWMLILDHNHVVDLSPFATHSVPGYFLAGGQTSKLEQVELGERVSNPIRGVDNLILPSEVSGVTFDQASNEWYFETPGQGEIHWGDPSGESDEDTCAQDVSYGLCLFDGVMSQRGFDPDAVIQSELVVSNPVNVNVAEGDTATFEVTATSTAGQNRFVWERSIDGGITWTPIPDSDSARLSVASTELIMTGNLYRVTVLNDSDSATVTTSAATLTVVAQTTPPGPGTGGGTGTGGGNGSGTGAGTDIATPVPGQTQGGSISNAGASAGLALTGTDPAPMLALGAALLALTGILLVAKRRRASINL